MWPRRAPSPPLHGPQSPIAATTATTAAFPPSTATASTAMPRMSFSLRSPPARAASPPKPPTPDAHSVPVFTGDVWVPATPSYLSFGFGAKWAKAPLSMWLARVVDDAAARPMLHLQLGDLAAVVATSVYQLDPRPTADVPPVAKKPVHVDVKAVEDVRRAMLYHTAAARATLAFYVDTDVARDHLVHLIQEVLAATAASPPSCAAAGSPTRPHAALVRPPSPPAPTAAAAPTAMDRAFALLESARAMQQRGHVVDALTAYVAADHALAVLAAQPHVGADVAALRARILDARREIRAAAEVLEMEKALPRAAVAIAATTVDVSEPPPPPASTTSAPQSTIPPVAINTRLSDLRTFAHARDVDRAQRERRVDTEDLSLRLHALRNAKPTAPSLESLQQRLERLRGNGGDGTTPPSPPPGPPPSTLSQVDLIVQQAIDEVAMGLVDGVDDAHDGLSSSSSDHSDSSDSSSSDSDDQVGRHRGRGRGRP